MREKRSGWKEENHIKEVDQTPKKMIIDGSRWGEKRWGTTRYRYTVESINNVMMMIWSTRRIGLQLIRMDLLDDQKASGLISMAESLLNLEVLSKD